MKISKKKSSVKSREGMLQKTFTINTVHLGYSEGINHIQLPCKNTQQTGLDLVLFSPTIKLYS